MHLHVILFPHQEQDGGGALVVQWKHGGAGKRIYASKFDKKTPGQEDLSKVACFCANAEFKPEDLVKPVVERELVWDEPASIPPMPSLFDAAEMAW